MRGRHRQVEQRKARLGQRQVMRHHDPARVAPFQRPSEAKERSRLVKLGAREGEVSGRDPDEHPATHQAHQRRRSQACLLYTSRCV